MCLLSIWQKNLDPVKFAQTPWLPVRAELRVRQGACICAQAKDDCVLTQKRVRETGTVREVSMQNLLHLGVRDVELLAPDSGHSSDGRVFECAAKSVSANHSRCAHDYKACLVLR